MIAIQKSEPEQRQIYAHPVKVTALEYIREAVRDERYEELKDTLAIAREFGADEWEIWVALTKGLRAGQNGR
jgi:hypothetical protein